MSVGLRYKHLYCLFTIKGFRFFGRKDGNPFLIHSIKLKYIFTFIECIKNELHTMNTIEEQREHINYTIRNTTDDCADNYGKGYMVAFSNELLKDNIFKVSFINADNSDDLIKQINQINDKNDIPLNIEFAKKVSSEMGITIHKILDDKEYRKYSDKEYFNCKLIELFNIFKLIKGVWYIKKEKRSRKLETCFINGQKIRHKLKENTWTGEYVYVYDREKMKMKGFIMYNKILYTLNQFTVEHYQKVRPDRTSSNNAWDECECERDGEWIKINNLPYLT